MVRGIAPSRSIGVLEIVISLQTASARFCEFEICEMQATLFMFNPLCLPDKLQIKQPLDP